MSEDQDVPDLLDLKFLPAWLKEAPDKNVYADYAGEEERPTAPAALAASNVDATTTDVADRSVPDTRRDHGARGRVKTSASHDRRRRARRKSGNRRRALPRLRLRFVSSPMAG